MLTDIEGTQKRLEAKQEKLKRTVAAEAGKILVMNQQEAGKNVAALKKEADDLTSSIKASLERTSVQLNSAILKSKDTASAMDLAGRNVEGLHVQVSAKYPDLKKEIGESAQHNWAAGSDCIVD